MKIFGEVEEFLTLVFDIDEWSSSPLQKSTSTFWIGGSLDPKANLGAVEERKISCPCWKFDKWFIMLMEHTIT